MPNRVFKPVGIATDTPGDALTLVHSPLLAGAGLYQTLRNMAGGSSGQNYQVTAGKTLYILGVTLVGAAAGGSLDEIGYADTAVNLSGARGTNAITFPMRFNAPTTPMKIDMFLAVPAGKFPYAIFATQAGTAIFHCVEL